MSIGWRDMVSTAEMGVQTMNKQSANKATKIDTIDKSKHISAAPANKDELSEQELEKASGGTFLRFDFKSVFVTSISQGGHG